MKNMRVLATGFAVGLTYFGVTGCAHSQLESQLDEKLQQAPAVAGTADLSRRAGETIVGNPNLTPEQKEKLGRVQASLREDLASYRDQSLKLRALLIQDMAPESYNPGEVDLIKKRLKELDERRLSSLFKAVDDANGILGRENPAKRRVMEEFFEDRGPRID